MVVDLPTLTAQATSLNERKQASGAAAGTQRARRGLYARRRVGRGAAHLE